MHEAPFSDHSDDFNNQVNGLSEAAESDLLSPTNLEINPATGLPMIDDSMIDVAGNVYGTDSLETFSDDLHSSGLDHYLETSSDDFSSFDLTSDDPFQSSLGDHFSSGFDDDKW